MGRLSTAGIDEVIQITFDDQQSGFDLGTSAEELARLAQIVASKSQ